jgi:5-formyltetrahydrofolate cyclo-ligase
MHAPPGPVPNTRNRDPKVRPIEAEDRKAANHIMDVPRDRGPDPSGSGKEAKRQLRASCRQRRDELGEAYRQRASERICEAIQEWHAFRAAHVVFAYLPIKGEVDLRPLIARSPEAQWAIPRIVRSPVRHLAFHAYQPDRVIPHRYGMLEPDPALPEIEPEQADLIIVPGLAFTRAGYRLGYGGGYYDHLLSTPRRAATIGACYLAQLLDDLPHDLHDFPVGNLVTETFGVIACHVASPGIGPALG